MQPSQVNTKFNLFDQFESEIVASTQLPYCQIQNPPNLSLSQIEQLNPPWGWFIPADQAELADFKTTDDWQPFSRYKGTKVQRYEGKTTQVVNQTFFPFYPFSFNLKRFARSRLTFGEDTSNPCHVDGFLATHIRIVVLHQSSIEVQEKTKNGWRYYGLAYQHGQLTSYGESAYSDRNNYRLRTRYLVMFVDTDNQLLHEIPFKIGMNAGVGAAFNTELKEFRKEIETVFFAQIGKSQQQLSSRAHSLTVLDLQLGLHKSESKSPFIYPQQGLTPDKSTTLTRRDRSVELLHSPIEEMIIPKNSDEGKTILSLWEQHQDFAHKYQDDIAESVDDDEPPF